MSNDFLGGGAARTFYGDPQHETAGRTDPERLTVTVQTRQCERALYDYARTTEPDHARAYADALAAEAEAV